MIRICAAIFTLLITTLSAAAQSGSVANFLDVISSRSDIASEKGDSLKESQSFQGICPTETSAAAKKILSEYGAIFVASEKVVPPPTCRFQNDTEVAAFQSKIATGYVILNGVQIQLQKPAADSLNSVIADGIAEGIRVRPLDGSIAAGRSYSDTVRLWNSRLLPALRYYAVRNQISADDVAAIIEMLPDQQIEEIIGWENQRLKFGTNRASSIFASTAPPGASQHLSLIAFDVAPPVSPTVIWLMNLHGWYQTVKGDRSHFTYLGLTEKELPARGLKALVFDGIQYWVPNIAPDNNPNQ
jgi:hypothetical protein